MSELYEKSLAKLELDKVLEMLAECAGSEEAKTACRGLRPVSNLEDVKARLAETTAASDLSTKKDSSFLSFVKQNKKTNLTFC